LASPPPTRPPISACDLLDGMPNIQVIAGSTRSPGQREKTTLASIIMGIDDAGPSFCATCSPKKKNAMK